MTAGKCICWSGNKTNKTKPLVVSSHLSDLLISSLNILRSFNSDMSNSVQFLGLYHTTRNAVYHHLSKIRPWAVNLRSSPKRGMGAFSRVVMFFSKICQPHKQVKENCLRIIIQINSAILLTSVHSQGCTPNLLKNFVCKDFLQPGDLNDLPLNLPHLIHQWAHLFKELLVLLLKLPEQFGEEDLCSHYIVITTSA